MKIDTYGNFCNKEGGNISVADWMSKTVLMDFWCHFGPVGQVVNAKLTYHLVKE